MTHFSINLISGGIEHDFILKPLFEEPTISLKHHLTALGHTVGDGGTQIILNFCIVPDNHDVTTLSIKAGTILWNQESFGNHLQRWKNAAEAYHKCGAVIWELRQENVAHWKEIFDVEALYVPFGYAPELLNVPQYNVKPIDLLFYGVLSPRRRKVMEYVRQRGYNIHFHSHGPSKENLMGLSKIIMSARAYEHVDQVECIRLIHSMGNSCCSAFEIGSESMGLEKGAIAAPIEGLGAAIVEALRDQPRRLKLASEGHLVAKATGPVMRRWLKEAVGDVSKL